MASSPSAGAGAAGAAGAAGCRARAARAQRRSHDASVPWLRQAGCEVSVAPGASLHNWRRPAVLHGCMAAQSHTLPSCPACLTQPGLCGGQARPRAQGGQQGVRRPLRLLHTRRKLIRADELVRERQQKLME